MKKKPTAAGKSADPKKAAIDAALKRAAEKKAQLAEKGVKPENTQQLTEAQQRQVDAADARRNAARPAEPPADAAAVETERQDG